MTLIGGGQSKLSEAEVRSAVADYLGSKIEHSRTNLTIALSSVPAPAPAQAGAVPPPVAAVGTGVAASVHAAPGEMRYTVQPGDILADLSLAFDGSPEHWRRIADANPGPASSSRGW